MPAEFLELPMVNESGIKDSQPLKTCLVQTVATANNPAKNMGAIREKIRCRVEGNIDSNSRSKVQSLVHRIERKLQHREKHSIHPPNPSLPTKHIFVPIRSERCQPTLHASETLSKSDSKAIVRTSNEPDPYHCSCRSWHWFASYDTPGILDTGATKTVMGNNHVKGFLDALSPEVRKQVQRTSCDIMFRFGNQGTLQAVHALVVPLAGMKLKIAVVEGATPFLVSNTLLRAWGAMIDTSQNQIVLPKHQVKIPLKLSAKGLYLVDTNELFKVAPLPSSQTEAAETLHRTIMRLPKCLRSQHQPCQD